ncbi:uncharacterized protein LOC128673955 [Plodia interpunctella]|uniref:uncharacterized protein LOC128673955 n=1 Tax=Plodia interpunctella TaxID=58824 RepID=UPI002368AA16|nr:uncharacterized protein LOC128673955 [Plodia interpunctella]
MWYMWTTLLLVSCALVWADEGTGAEALLWRTTTGAPPQTHQHQAGLFTTTASFATPTTLGDQTVPAQDTRLQPVQATSRAPSLTLDRKASELAWRSWLQSPESGNQNAPPRRIITKSLFITPLVCPKGQRLDRNGCVQVVTVNKDEHERILLEQLNALFPTASSGGDYDYGDDEPGPLQLTLPIGLDPQAAPLQGQEPSTQAQGLQPTFVDKKDSKFPSDASIEAELELLKLHPGHNHTESSDVLNHNVMNTLLPTADKPKRDSPVDKSASTQSQNTTTDEGQKEIVYGHVNVDPVVYGSQNDNQEKGTNTHFETQKKTSAVVEKAVIKNMPSMVNDNKTGTTNASSEHLKKDTDKTKLNPENDYSDIGEAIKLISRYAEVTTDDDYAKNQKKYAIKEDSTLGTRTKLQYRRNRPKPEMIREPQESGLSSDISIKDKIPMRTVYPKNEQYYRYPWIGQHSPTPPPNYPFRHLQDYWPGRTQIGGVYNTHENPRRHHHSYPHYFRPRAYNFGNSEIYSGQDPFSHQNQMYTHRVAQRHASPSRFHNKNQELYNLLGLRHWFSNEGTSKR